jgi:hypothetical protein
MTCMDVIIGTRNVTDAMRERLITDLQRRWTELIK